MPNFALITTYINNMIYYFSGTGNSEYVARLAATKLGDTLSDVVKPTPFSGDTLGLIMPVYAWGIPRIVENFITNTLPPFISGKNITYTWCILTHGDDMGYADKVLSKHLATIGIQLRSVFSLSMPNTYVCLPGFDVDSTELANKKIDSAVASLDSITTTIKKRDACTHLIRGAFPLIKTYVIRPFFNKFLVTDRYFHVNRKACTHCSLCAKLCPLGNISMVDSSPKWQGNCTGCLCCYHACPSNAIQFGKFTKGKGQKKSPPCSRKTDIC